MRKTQKFCSTSPRATKIKGADGAGISFLKKVKFAMRSEVQQARLTERGSLLCFTTLICHHLSLKDSCARVNNNLGQFCFGKEQIKSVKKPDRANQRLSIDL